VGTKHRDLTLRTKVFLASAVLVAAAAAAPVIFLPSRLEGQARRHLEGRALDLARAFAAASEVPLDFEDKARAAEVLEGLDQSTGATYGLLLDHDGMALADWGPVPVPLPELDGSGQAQLWHGDTMLHVAVPVVSAGGERGTLRLGLGLEELERRRSESRSLVAFTALAVLLVGLAAAFAAGSALTRSIRRVSEVAERISRGDTEAASGLETAQGGEARTVASALGGLLTQISAQGALLASQAEASTEGILTLGLQGEVLTHNRRLSELWSIGAESLVSASWSSVRAAMAVSLGATLPGWLEQAVPALPGGRAQSFDLELRDGRFLSAHAAPVDDAEGRSLGLGLYFRDLTDMKRAEERVRALNQELESRVADRTRELAAANQELAERLAELRRTQEQLVVADRRIAVGRLAAGVAHEINNPLAYTTANLRYVAERLPALRGALESGDGDARQDAVEQLGDLGQALSESIEGADRVARIVRGLRAFSRPEEMVSGVVQVARAMSAALDMAEHEIRHRAKVVRDYQPAPPVRGDPVRLQQVFLNLLINAAQAITRGNVEENAIRVSVGRDAAGWAVAEVSDTGCGIAPEAMNLIFDPFYTTKPQGQGTGLGLSISQGIVASLQGRIEVQSQPGLGSVFRVLLPPTDAALTPAPPARHPRSAPASALRVLVVDDEPNVLAALQRVLAEHRVEVAASGRDALSRIEGGERFDRIVCDLVMPAMTGMELHAHLEQVAPEQARAMVFMTGGVFTQAAADFADRHQGRCLAKPFEVEALLEVLHEQT